MNKLKLYNSLNNDCYYFDGYTDMFIELVSNYADIKCLDINHPDITCISIKKQYVFPSIIQNIGNPNEIKDKYVDHTIIDNLINWYHTNIKNNDFNDFNSFKKYVYDELIGIYFASNISSGDEYIRLLVVDDTTITSIYDYDVYNNAQYTKLRQVAFVPINIKAQDMTYLRGYKLTDKNIYAKTASDLKYEVVVRILIGTLIIDNCNHTVFIRTNNMNNTNISGINNSYNMDEIKFMFDYNIHNNCDKYITNNKNILPTFYLYDLKK